MAETLDIAPERRPAPPSSFLMAKLSALRRKQVQTSAFTGGALALGVAVELLALVMFLDWWLDLAWGLRLFLLVGQAALFTDLILRYVASPVLRPPDDDALALMVEKARPTFRGRLIAALQLSRPGTWPAGISASMVDALVEETERVAAPMDFNDAVTTDYLIKLGSVALLVTALGAFGLIYCGKVPTDLLKRAFLSSTPVPRKTRIMVAEGNRIVGRGDSVRLEASVSGVIPATGKVEVRHPGGRAQDFSLEQDRENRRRFGRTIENVQESFTHTFYLGDSRSPAYEVRALPRPTVSNLECEQEFPAYTKLKAARRSPGDLSLLAGSRLTLTGTATKPIRAAALKFAGTPGHRPVPGVAGFPPRLLFWDVPAELMPLNLGSQNPAGLSGSFTVPAKGLAGFSVLLVDTEGMESRDSALYRVDTIPDKVPVVRITVPERKEELVTRQAVMPIAFEAADDFAIVKVRLRYKIDTIDEGAEKAVELDLEGATPARLKRRHEWRIGAFAPLLADGSRLEYWVEAEDNNDATGPGVGTSEHRFARVVSETDKRAELLNRAGDYLGSISDLAGDEEQLNQMLGAIIREKMER